MGRSQRHQLFEQGSTSAGEVHAQGAVAPGISAQIDPSQLNVLVEKEAAGPVGVPEGPPGGPLQGSSLTGAIPPGAIPPEPGQPPTITSLEPDSGAYGDEDITVNIHGTNFAVNNVMVWNGADDHATYVSDVLLTTVVKLSTATVAIDCTVAIRNALDLVSNEVVFHIVEPAAANSRVSAAKTAPKPKRKKGK